MSWQDLPIYSRNDGSFIISYNNAPYHVAKTEGGFTEQYPALVTWEEVSAFVSENPDKVTPEVPVTVTPATPPSARTVNNVIPNSAGNVTLNIPQGTVTSINNVTPNSAGRVTLAPANITGAGQVVPLNPVSSNGGLTYNLYMPSGGSWFCWFPIYSDKTVRDATFIYAGGTSIPAWVNLSGSIHGIIVNQGKLPGWAIRVAWVTYYWRGLCHTYIKKIIKLFRFQLNN